MIIRAVMLACCFGALISSCTNEQKGFNKVRQFYHQFTKQDLEDFLYTEFGFRGDVEMWTIHIDSVNHYFWDYDTVKRTSDFSIHYNELLSMKKIDSVSARYFEKLRKRKAELQLIGISQSPWIGVFIKFYLTPRDVAIYVPDSFKTPSGPQWIWLAEFNRGVPFDQNWVYYNLDWDKLNKDDLTKRRAKLEKDQ